MLFMLQNINNTRNLGQSPTWVCLVP